VPSLGSLLRAIDVPPTGGDTLWADMGAAYDCLDEVTRERIDGLVAVHDWCEASAEPGTHSGFSANSKSPSSLPDTKKTASPTTWMSRTSSAVESDVGAATPAQGPPLAAAALAAAAAGELVPLPRSGRAVPVPSAPGSPLAGAAPHPARARQVRARTRPPTAEAARA